MRQLESTSVAENVLPLNFTDATDPIYDGNSSSLWGANESSVLLYEGLRKEQGKRYGQTGSETACFLTAFCRAHIEQRLAVLTLRWTRMNLKFYSISLTWHNILRYFDAKLQKNK